MFQRQKLDTDITNLSRLRISLSNAHFSIIVLRSRVFPTYKKFKEQTLHGKMRKTFKLKYPLWYRIGEKNIFKYAFVKRLRMYRQQTVRAKNRSLMIFLAFTRCSSRDVRSFANEERGETRKENSGRSEELARKSESRRTRVTQLEMCTALLEQRIYSRVVIIAPARVTHLTTIIPSH